MQQCAKAAQATAQAAQPTRLYVLVDLKTGLVVGKPYTSAQRARTRRDKLDLEYGACRYYVRAATTGAVVA
jgi:hypothetical protein